MTTDMADLRVPPRGERPADERPADGSDMRALLHPRDRDVSGVDDARGRTARALPAWYGWSPFAGGTDVLCVERTASDPALHLHGTLQVSLVQRPTVSTDAHGHPHPALPRALLTVNPHELHGDGPLGGAAWYVRELHVGPDVLDDVVAGLSGQCEPRHLGSGCGARHDAPRFPVRVVDDDPLSAQLNALWDDMRGDVATDVAGTFGSARTANALALERESRLVCCLGALVARHARRSAELPPVGRGDQGVRRAREYLHAHVKDHVALADLAGVAGVNKFYLIRAFEREVGIPPHAYQTQLRLSRARHLIERGEPLSQVAFDVGFADQSHLTRRFKTLFGVTPGQYARCGKWSTAAAGGPVAAEHTRGAV